MRTAATDRDGRTDRRRRVAIAFTGPDGAGKSTQIAALDTHLRSLSLDTVIVHQYDPITRVVTVVKNSLRRRSGTAIQNTFAKPGTVRDENAVDAPDRRGPKVVLGAALRPAVAVWWLFGGWWRSFAKMRTHRDHDVLILDRCYIDEIVRSTWKAGIGKRLGLALIKLVPPPDIVFELDVDETVSWSRKKAFNSSREEYERKVGIVRDVMLDVRARWPVQVIPVADRTKEAVADEVVDAVTPVIAERSLIR